MIGEGGFATIEPVTLPSAAGVSGNLVVKRYWIGRRGRHQGLSDRAPDSPVFDLVTRAITVGDDQAVQRLREHLVLPRAYGYDPVTGDVLIFLDRYTYNLTSYLAVVAEARPARYGRSLIEAFIRAGDGLAALHRAGYKHRDVKPDNLLVDANEDFRIESIRWTDFDTLGLQQWRPSEGVTTILDESDGMVGTYRYLSPSLLLREVTVKAAENRIFDNYAFGIMLAEAVFPESSLSRREEAIEETILRARDDLRRRADLERRAQELGLAGIERVLVRATDTADHGYETMDELTDDLRLVSTGAQHRVVRKRENRVAWEYRTGRADGDRYLAATRRRRRRSQLAIAAALGLAAWSGLSMMARRQYDAARAGSVEGIARQAIDLSPERLQALLDAREREFRQETQQTHAPLLDAPGDKVFPEGSFVQVRDRYVEGTDATAQDWLRTLDAWWHVTDDPQYLEWYARYASRLELQLSTEYNDREFPVVGRYAPLLERAPAMLREERLSDGSRQALRKAYDDALSAAAIGLDQYARGQRHEKMDLLDEWLLLPLVADIAVSPERDEILRRANAQRPPGTRAWDETRLVRLIADSGKRICAALVDEEGKTFWQATRKSDGTIELRGQDDRVPGYDGTPQEQAVTAQAHATVMLSLEQRQRALRANTHQEATADIVDLERCEQRADTYLKRHVQPGFPLPEYLYLPPMASTVRNLPQEMHGTTIYLRYLRESGSMEAHDQLLSSILRQARFGYPPVRNAFGMPQADPERLMGVFPSTRGYARGHIGPIYASEANFIESVADAMARAIARGR